MRGVIQAVAGLVVIGLVVWLVGLAIAHWQDGSCEELGAKAVTTSGNGGYICVDPNGRIVGP